MNKYKDIHSAYLGTLKDVLDNYQYKTAPRGIPILECVDYMFRVENPLPEAIITLDLERNITIASYTQKETELYDSCSNKVEDFAKASKFWEKIANPDGTINSAYGKLIWKDKSLHNKNYECGSGIGAASCNFTNQYAKKMQSYKRTPWEWAKQSLIQDKDTRQAVLRFSRPDHHWKGNNDFVCTMHGNFLIRDDKLHLSIIMRSNDLVKGLAYDLPWFISLIHKMVEELKPTYPNLQPGSYTHLSHSMHIYEKDIPIIKRMLGNDK